MCIPISVREMLLPPIHRFFCIVCVCACGRKCVPFITMILLLVGQTCMNGTAGVGHLAIAQLGVDVVLVRRVV